MQVHKIIVAAVCHGVVTVSDKSERLPSNRPCSTEALLHKKICTVQNLNFSTVLFAGFMCVPVVFHYASFNSKVGVPITISYRSSGMTHEISLNAIEIWYFLRNFMHKVYA